MPKNTLSWLSIGALALGLGSTTACRSARPAAPPNIILISIDTLRADRLGSYGYSRPTSPNLDAFRRDAILARETIAAASSTLLAHASLFTSSLPQHHGASHTHNKPLAPAATTLAEVLAANGYSTQALVGSGQMIRQYGIDQGFEVWEELPETSLFRNTVQRALYRLDHEPVSSPFLLFLHSYEVHHDYRPERRHLEALDPAYREGPVPLYTSTQLWELSHQESVPAEEVQRIGDAYDAEIRSMDESLGVLLQGLRERGLYDDTIIVFTSDHGEELGEHGYLGWHSHTLYDELLRIPLLVKLPGGLHAGRTLDGTVRQIDIAPTLLGLAGIEVPVEFAGRDLLPFLSRRPGFDLPAVLARERAPFETGNFWGIRAEGWKLQYGQLFDLTADPGETTDLAASRPDQLRRLEEMLQRAVAARPRLEAPAVTLDAEAEAGLRSLGYVR
jgi:arylsulfatase A-like enzyme